MACIDNFESPLKTENKILHRFLVIFLISVPPLLTIIFTVIYIVIPLIVDYLLAELSVIVLLISYVYLSKYPHQSVDSSNIFNTALYLLTWYVTNLISSMIHMSSMEMWMSVIGVAPVITIMAIFVIGMPIYYRCFCCGKD